jgi:copper homeostasis protein
MLRENEDYSVPEGEDFERLCATALELEQIGVDGIVVGYLRNGRVEMAKMLELMDSVPQLGATLHHAFDDSESPLDTIAALKKSDRIDRILSSGGPGTISERAVRLQRYQQQALGDIIILAGGGMDEEAIHFLCTQTGIREFHVGRAARSPHNSSGAVRSESVNRLRRLISEDRCKMLEPSGSAGGANG